MTNIRYNRIHPIAHTYSIVARDPETGDMGVGVQSHYFDVSVVAWGESGVGVVATQSFLNKSFGLRGLELLKKGKSPEEALKILLSDDDGKDVRQVSILDVQGNVATHTGLKCIKQAGHIMGDNYSVQANLMLSDKVWSKMAEAYENDKDLPLPERIVKTLKAAESVGGDIRGMQSAALLIVRGEPIEEKWEDPLIDLRVEDHKKPLEELSRLLKLYRAYERMDNGDQAFEKGDINKALEEYNTAMEMCPDNLEMKYWTAVSLANSQKVDEALPIFEDVFKEDNNWRVLTERLPEVELLKLKKEDLNKILLLK
ncbi:MAG: DUF1028 domain-containing protein [Candidatus Hodarchaeota archaeon]